VNNHTKTEKDSLSSVLLTPLR